MADLSYKHYAVLGISAAVPPRVRQSAEFVDWIGQEAVDKFVKTVGVVQGHIADEHMTAADLCACAGNRLLDELAIERDSIDVLLFVSQTPDYVAPSSACLLQYRLGLAEDCLAYDINLACSGFVYGLSAALGYLQTAGIRRVLLLCGDTVSKHCSPLDKGLAMLSADAGTALLLERNEASTADATFRLKTIGRNYRSLIVPYGGYRHRFGCAERTEREPGIVRSDYDGYMNGADVFRFSITEVPRLMKDFLSDHDLTAGDFDHCFLHQANLFIMNNIAKRTGLIPAQYPVSLDRYGNTGAASIPLTICDYHARSGSATANERILICGFGIGLSLGVGALSLEATRILPVAVCEEAFDDQIDNLHQETRSFVE